MNNDEPWGNTDHYQFKKIFDNPYTNLPNSEEEEEYAWEFSKFRLQAMYAVIDNE